MAQKVKDKEIFIFDDGLESSRNEICRLYEILPKMKTESIKCATVTPKDDFRNLSIGNTKRIDVFVLSWHHLGSEDNDYIQKFQTSCKDKTYLVLTILMDEFPFDRLPPNIQKYFTMNKVKCLKAAGHSVSDQERFEREFKEKINPRRSSRKGSRKSECSYQEVQGLFKVSDPACACDSSECEDSRFITNHRECLGKIDGDAPRNSGTLTKPRSGDAIGDETSLNSTNETDEDGPIARQEFSPTLSEIFDLVETLKKDMEHTRTTTKEDIKMVNESVLEQSTEFRAHLVQVKESVLEQSMETQEQIAKVHESVLEQSMEHQDKLTEIHKSAAAQNTKISEELKTIMQSQLEESTEIIQIKDDLTSIKDQLETCHNSNATQSSNSSVSNYQVSEIEETLREKLLALSSDIGEEWPMFFRHLINNQQVIESFRERYDKQEVPFQLLQHWIRQPGASTEDLKAALVHIQHPRADDEPMSKTHKEAIRMNRIELERGIITIDRVCSHLYQEGILSDYLKDTILSEKTGSQKVSKLLDILPKRGERAFTVFLDVLIKHKYEHCAALLSPEYSIEYCSDQTLAVPGPSNDRDDTEPNISCDSQLQLQVGSFASDQQNCPESKTSISECNNQLNNRSPSHTLSDDHMFHKSSSEHKMPAQNSTETIAETAKSSSPVMQPIRKESVQPQRIRKESNSPQPIKKEPNSPQTIRNKSNSPQPIGKESDSLQPISKESRKEPNSPQPIRKEPNPPNCIHSELLQPGSTLHYYPGRAHNQNGKLGNSGFNIPIVKPNKWPAISEQQTVKFRKGRIQHV